MLVVLCSGAARAEDVPVSLARRLGKRLICRDVADREHVSMPAFRSSSNELSSLYRSTDTGLKRNLALALGIASGWSHVLFLDDDIEECRAKRSLDAHCLADALAALETDSSFRAVGWQVRTFPDNSVIGHARRLLDHEQDTFVGGGALLVRCDLAVPFFPDIFNEDWLFLIATALAAPNYRTSIGCAGLVEQLEYDPFRVIRAQAEEAGDIIGESLMNLLEDDGPALLTQAKNRWFWRRALKARATLIAQLNELLLMAPPRPELVEIYSRMRTALSAARDVHQLIRPEAITDYISAWQDDLADWRAHLTRVAAMGLQLRHDPSLALEWLLSAGPPRQSRGGRVSSYYPRHAQEQPAALTWAMALSALVGAIKMQTVRR